MSDSVDMRNLFSAARAEAESAPEHPRLHPPDVYGEGDRKTDPPSAEFEAQRVASSRPPMGDCDHGPALPWRSSVEMAVERERVLAYDFGDDRQLALASVTVEKWRVVVDMVLLRSEP